MECCKCNSLESIIGSDYSMRVSLYNLPFGLTMDDLSFKCEFYVRENKTELFEKRDMIREDANSYKAIVHTAKLNSGLLRCKITVVYPDGRSETKIFSTNEFVSR